MSIEEIRDFQIEKLNRFERPWLSVAECAEVLGLSDTAVRSAIEYGELEAQQYKKGCRYRVVKTSIRSYIETLELNDAF